MADHYAVESYEHDLLADLAKYGDDFLVNEDIADLNEVLYEQQEAGAEIGEDESYGTDDPDSVSKPSPPITAKSDQASLFRLPVLLQLMRNVFMNNGEQDHLNWHHIQPVLEDSSEPAIYKSALEDLNTIVGNLIRRLVQATIFQTMTRLRAGDSSRSDWTPLAAIREVDVHQAVYLLNMKPNWHHYWADAVERNHLAVYSDSKKYQDGRPGKKFGYRLTSGEVRKELVGEFHETPDHSDHEDVDDLEEDIADVMEDSDVFTDDGVPSDHSSETANSDSEAGPSRPGGRKRKRALTPRAFARSEDKYLEVMDQHHSMQEEVRLWRSLGLDPPQELSDPKPNDLEGPRARLEPSKAKPWRDTIDYCNDWELGFGVPKESEFLDMDREGCRASLSYFRVIQSSKYFDRTTTSVTMKITALLMLASMAMANAIADPANQKRCKGKEVECRGDDIYICKNGIWQHDKTCDGSKGKGGNGKGGSSNGSKGQCRNGKCQGHN
ncbi:hypothetical protein HII31_03217 [Pseudocercospora fuligena]|uniref:Uncharacterized protein n=1 Tax=Pseudocercospora fuligena TaxID=685502 RepID=A0A8H6VKR3_9PEZI|nr:hypothetical protein HII31_03217 [Pseudocercospora fuligena]